MRIRTRLTILLIVVVVVALVFVGVSGLSLYQSKSVESSAKYKLLELQYAASVKNNLLEILSSVACEWLHGAGHQSHAQTMELGEKIGRTLTSWHELEMLQAQQFGEAQQLGNVNQLNNIIAHYQSSLARHHDDMLLAKQAGSGSSNAFINSTLLLGGDLILAGKLEEATSKILIQADAVLNSLFLFVGWVPWISSATKIQTEHARAALQYYAALDRAQTSFVQELQVILQFLVRDKELARRDVLEMALQTQNRLEDVLDVVKNQMALGVEGEEEDRLAVEKFIAEQNARVELFLFFYDFKKANNLQADLTPDQHEKLDLIVLDAADFFRKRLSDGQGEIAESVQVLLRKSSEVRMILTGFFLALWVITTSFLVGLGLRIFRSLQKLQRGTSQLAAGNFEHRIDLSSSDEFGDVASSFNAMVSQLHSSRQELMGLNMKLGEEIVVRSQAEEALAVQAGQLRERVKELQCLHKITIILETADVSLPEILQRIVNELPGAWQFPDISCARISLAEMDLCTAGFKKTIWRQACDIIINGRPKGVLEVCYREERPAADEGPFLKEERFLLEIIAARLAHFYGRVKTEQELRLSQERLAAAQRIARLGNWIWELNENKMWWSDEVYEIFALDPATYVPTFDSFLARVYPADCERFAQAIEKSLADKAHCSVEHRIILPSGVVRTVQEDGEIICDQSGQAVKILGTVQDISRFKAIE
ncbi:MAG: PAS domain-containing protein, partial [Desulfobulbaceae bacterium]|nr:PAS domain-containing protein [Desulfobulbaceae bacterium]